MVCMTLYNCLYKAIIHSYSFSPSAFSWILFLKNVYWQVHFLMDCVWGAGAVGKQSVLVFYDKHLILVTSLPVYANCSSINLNSLLLKGLILCLWSKPPWKKTWQVLWLICTLSFWLGSFLSHRNIQYYISSTSLSYFWGQSPMNLFPIIGSISLSKFNEKALINWLVV